MRKGMLLAVVSGVLFSMTASAKDGHHDHKQETRVMYSGPVAVTQVSELTAMTIGEKDVIVEGKLVQQLANGNFMFEDATGQMMIDLDDDVILNRPLDNTMTVRLIGEYEAWDKEMDVDRIEVL